MNEQKKTEAFPLSWPSGYPRSKNRKRARFGSQFAKARDGIFRELRLMGATQVVLSTNLGLRRDGLPYAASGLMSDPGVAVYFFRKTKQLVLACDEWDRIEDNIHAVELSIGAMRGLDRWGCSDILDRAFTGFIALPAPSSPKKEWWDVLLCKSDASIQVIEANYKSLSRTAHPDVGGSNEKMAQLNQAVEAARRSNR